MMISGEEMIMPISGYRSPTTYSELLPDMDEEMRLSIDAPADDAWRPRFKIGRQIRSDWCAMAESPHVVLTAACRSNFHWRGFLLRRRLENLFIMDDSRLIENIILMSDGLNMPIIYGGRITECVGPDTKVATGTGASISMSDERRSKLTTGMTVPSSA